MLKNKYNYKFKISFTILVVLFFCISLISVAKGATAEPPPPVGDQDTTNINLHVDNPKAEPPPDRIPSYLRIISGNNQTSRNRNLDPLVVQILDQNNNPLSGITISFSYTEIPVGANGYSLSAGSKSSDGNGIVSVEAILGDKTGHYTVSASTGTLSVFFALNYSPIVVPPGPVVPPTTPTEKLVPTTLKIVSGNNQISPRQSLSDQIVLQVLDQNNHPMSGIRVDIFFSTYPDGSTGYAIAPITGITDQNGFVRFQVTLGNKEGDYKITATATGGLAIIINAKYEVTTTSRIADGIDNAAKAISNITDPVANSKIAQIANKPMAYTAIIWAILSPLIANAPIALPWLTYLFNWLMSFFSFGEKRKRWGIVYDSVTRKPVPGVDVSLFNTQYNQLVETQTTDQKGRFVMNVKAGTYYLMASMENYTYPSEYDLVGYRGKHFSINESGSIIVIDIPIDPIGKSTFKRRVSVPSFSKLVDKIYYPVMIVGSLLSVATALNRYDLTNFVILGLYEAMWIFELFKLLKTKHFGIIYDAITRKPVDYAIIRLFNATNRKLLSTKITNSDGHYSLLIGSGHYIMISAKDGYQTTTKELVVKKDNYIHENLFMKYPEQTTTKA